MSYSIEIAQAKYISELPELSRVSIGLLSAAFGAQVEFSGSSEN